MKFRLYKMFNTVLLMILIAIFTSMSFGIYLYAFESNPPVVINNNPVPTDRKIYHLGDNIYVTFDYCRYTDVPVTRYVSFYDGISFQLPPITGAGGKTGCNINKTKVATIPISLPIGTYHLEVRSEYRVNLLIERYVEWESQEFLVLP